MRPLAGKAMQNAAQIRWRPVFLDESQALVPCILRILRWTAMNHDWKGGRAAHLHLAYKDLSLHPTRGMVVVIVQADLSPGKHLGMFRQPSQFVKVLFAGQLGFMGMDPNRCVNPAVLIG